MSVCPGGGGGTGRATNWNQDDADYCAMGAGPTPSGGVGHDVLLSWVPARREIRANPGALGVRGYTRALRLCPPEASNEEVVLAKGRCVRGRLSCPYYGARSAFAQVAVHRGRAASPIGLVRGPSVTVYAARYVVPCRGMERFAAPGFGARRRCRSTVRVSRTAERDRRWILSGPRGRA